MKYFIAGVIVSIIIGILFSCTSTNKTRTVESIDGTAFDVIEVDSCEYLIAYEGYKGFMAHKGNCKYCEKRKKKE